MSLSLTGGRLSEDVTYRVHTVPGSARPGEDYRFEEGIEVVLEEGHLRAFDLENPLRIEVRRDWFVEAPREDFYLVVHMLAGAETPLVSWFERIEIVDDDRIGGEGGALWFGAAHEETLCPAGSRRFDLVEPAGGGAAPFRVDLVVAERAVAESGADDDATCKVGVGRSVASATTPGVAVGSSARLGPRRASRSPSSADWLATAIGSRTSGAEASVRPWSRDWWSRRRLRKSATTAAASSRSAGPAAALAMLNALTPLRSESR